MSELHPLEEITQVYFVRHGHTRATELGLLYSDPAIELTEKGVQQAKSAASYIKGIAPAVLLRGNAVRVVQSTAAVEEATGLTALSFEDFEEWQVGSWEGRTYLDIKEKDPEQYHSWCADPISNRPPGGESIADLSARIGKAMQTLIADKKIAGKTVCMVTHSGIIRSALVNALGMPVENFWRLSVPTGSVTRIDYSKNFATLHFLSLKP